MLETAYVFIWNTEYLKVFKARIASLQDQRLPAQFAFTFIFIQKRKHVDDLPGKLLLYMLSKHGKACLTAEKNMLISDSLKKR